MNLSLFIECAENSLHVVCQKAMNICFGRLQGLIIASYTQSSNTYKFYQHFARLTNYNFTSEVKVESIEMLRNTKSG